MSTHEMESKVKTLQELRRMAVNIAYPIDVTDFMRIQQEGIGRELDEGEKQIVNMSVDIINLAYEAGKNGSEQVFTPNDAVSFFSKGGRLDVLEQSAVTRVVLSLLYWTKRAYYAGEVAR